ncbi:hypothetical protein GALMADRAFT_243881 [Galerina marginata CBS 339.88]|uniref:Uncharacterized protein n=1 Tax=Galerina marginata (strain CBS 339.88) TaxID=685588 RepID=A0A067T5V6_GALM3|nr:hypothetical protein GALMADRAFT_243881 [Galerina marginata CBS 339.88]
MVKRYHLLSLIFDPEFESCKGRKTAKSLRLGESAGTSSSPFAGRPGNDKEIICCWPQQFYHF